MLKAATITISMCVSTQAMAACHHFTRWYYPYPQRCKTEIAYVTPKIMPKPIEDKSWYVEIVLPDLTATWEAPGISREFWEEMQRKKALEKLKLQQH